jgi:hypothetical protein
MTDHPSLPPKVQRTELLIWLVAVLALSMFFLTGLLSGSA